MNWENVAKKLEGLQTADSVARRLDISRRTAINYVYELRKRGFIHEESRGRGGKRLYKIRPWEKRESGYPGLYEILNRNSPVKIARPYKERVHGSPLSVEQALVRAIVSRDFRTVLASLALFRKVCDWPALRRFAAQHGAERKAGALYDLARKSVPKIRRMDQRTRRALKAAPRTSAYIVAGLESDDFKDIQNEWGVKIPFSKADMEVYG